MGKRRDNMAYFLVRRGNRRRLRSLLRRHPELCTSNSALLLFVAMWHNRGMLRWLLERGVSPDCRTGNNGNTALMSAAAEGDVTAMKLLLEFDADPNLLNFCSENALGFAVTYNHVPAIELLVNSGVDINNTDDSGPNRTQLDCAELSDWSDVVVALRKLGAKRFKELDVAE